MLIIKPVWYRIRIFSSVKITAIVLAVFFLIGIRNVIFSQTITKSDFSYLSPVPSAKFVNPESSVAFRFADSMLEEVSTTSLTVEVAGSKSGKLSGKLLLAADQKTYIYQPVKPFLPGEQVNVGIHLPCELKFFRFMFTVSSTSKTHQMQILTEKDVGEISFETKAFKNTPNRDLPSGLPDITITHDNHPSPGYFFLGTISNKARANEFIAIYDNKAQPVFYRELPGNTSSDFKLQPNGNLSYHGRAHWEFYKMNPFFEVVDTIRPGNGMLADNHELLILENNHKFLLVHDVQLVDMSVIVPGGNPMATVIGLIVQELDENNNVVFQWRSWDHFEITDAADRINLVGSIIDYVHGNSIELDTDTSMIISCRNMDEVTRINRNTGEILWRLGGKRNQFMFVDSSQMFCHQHDARIVPGSGHLSVFDNGNCHRPQFSSAAEYFLDTAQMTVTLVNRLRSTPDIFGSFMGNAQRLENGRTIVGWGSGIPSITEFDEWGDIALQFSFNNINYRAFKFDWQSPILSTNVDTLIFDTIEPNDSTSAQLFITNHFHKEMVINEVFFQEHGYRLLDEFPVAIAAGEERTFSIQFKSSGVGDYDDVVTFCEDISTDEIKQRVSHQVFLKGRSQIQSGISMHDGASPIKVYPNPFFNHITVQNDHSDMMEVVIYDGMGKMLLRKTGIGKRQISLDIHLPAGFYQLIIKTKENQLYRTTIIKD